MKKKFFLVKQRFFLNDDDQQVIIYFNVCSNIERLKCVKKNKVVVFSINFMK